VSHDQSEIILICRFAAHETLLKTCAVPYFVETVIYINLWFIYICHVFTVTFN